MPNPSTLHEDSDFHGQENAHEDFDFDAVENEDDLIRDMQAAGKSLAQIVQMMVAHDLQHERARAICAILVLIQGRQGVQQRLLMIDVISYASGFGLINGETLESIGKRHGIAKQAVQNLVESTQQQLKIPLRVERSSEAKSKMRMTNYRPTKTT